jgi:pSer/pThr/pTyr-binding forkhead associated (FHA) protein
MKVMRGCPHCGRPIIDNAIFCLDCGAKVTDDPRTTIAELGADLTPGSYLLVVEGFDQGQAFEITPNGVTVIGREEAGVALRDPFVSRRHAEIRPANGHLELADLNSANRTFVNSLPVERRELRDGDLIEVGYTALLFRVKR